MGKSRNCHLHWGLSFDHEPDRDSANIRLVFTGGLGSEKRESGRVLWVEPRVSEVILVDGRLGALRGSVNA
jgi:hypothetical protein